ncbi:MAG: hypothetical protein EOP35_10215, partial [Rubrivivax sp.]
MLRWLSVLLWALMFAAAGGAAQAGEGLAHRYEQADHLVVPLSAADAGPPLEGGAWQPVALPDLQRRDVVRATEQGNERTMHWYRLQWTVPAGLAPGTPLVVYVPRVISQAAQLWRLEALGWRPVFDNQAGAMEQWNRPLLIPLPPDAMAPGQTLTLALGTPSRQGRFHALSHVWVGPEVELRERHALRSALQQTVPAAASLAMLALGLLSFIVWLGRRDERGYLYFACAAIGWTVRNLHLFINLPNSDTASEWFWWMTAASVSWLMLATYLFAFRFDARRLPRLERGLALFVLAGTLITVPGLMPLGLLVQHGTNLAAGLTVTGVLTVLAVRGGRRELRVIVAALWVILGFAVHDWLLAAQRITPETIYLLPYGALLLTGSFLYAALRRFTGAVAQAESASRVLAARLAEREAELALQHEQLRAVVHVAHQPLALQ